jgi:hypothetical protein
MRVLLRYWPVLSLTCVSMSALAQGDPKSAEALATIGNFGREFCVAADSTSTSTTVELSGDAKVKLNAVIQKIVDLEVGGGAKYVDTSTKGVLQKDLATAHMDTNKCRLRVLEILMERLLPATTPDPSATKIAGRWRDSSDDSHFINVVVHGQSFHSVEYDRFGRPVASVDGVISQGNVEGSAYIEPTPAGAKLVVIPERTLFGTVSMRLSEDATRLVGTFVTKNEKWAVKVEWVRP